MPRINENALIAYYERGWKAGYSDGWRDGMRNGGSSMTAMELGEALRTEHEKANELAEVLRRVSEHYPDWIMVTRALEKFDEREE